MEYIIRKSIWSDVKKLQEIFEEGDRFHYELEPTKFNLPQRGARKEDFFKDFFNNDNNTILVAELKSNFEIVGFVTGEIYQNKSNQFVKDEKFGFIGFMVVNSNYRRQGIATSLLPKIQEWFIEKNIEEIRLSVFAKNIAAYKLYEKLGYKTNMYKMVKSLKDF